ncbi:MAG: hypothetical protein Q8R42_08020, partial [Desulfocapsaceae bacterium]|nr:hypothetical protein [Desulfocapsaceae bacterium]
MEQKLLSLQDEARKYLDQLTKDGSLEEAKKQFESLEDFRIRYLGRKGQFSTIMRELGAVAPEERPRVGHL